MIYVSLTLSSPQGEDQDEGIKIHSNSFSNPLSPNLSRKQMAILEQQ
jgi:hypothetical protein